MHREMMNMPTDEVQIAEVIPTIVYRCPKCHSTFNLDDVESDEKGYYCPNEECDIRLILPVEVGNE